MPHIVVEYSDPPVFNVPDLLRELHETLAREESVDLKRIKTRAVPLKDFIVGDKGSQGAMVHITLKLMPRLPEVAKRMAQALHEIVRGKAGADCAVTVEVVELNPDTYCS